MFFLLGMGTANWAVRIPDVQRSLGLSEGMLGIALLSVAAGALIAMPIAGRLVTHFGSRPVTVAAAITYGLALALPPLAGSLEMLVAALLVVGLANGSMSVSINAQASAVQDAYGQPVMGRIHAFYSIGGLAGALAGGRVAAMGIGPAPHLAGVSVVIVLGACVAWAGMLPARADAMPGHVRAPGELRLLAPLGALAFFILFGEGAVMNWSAVYLRNVSQAGPGLAAAGFAAFSLTMAVGRLIGDGFIARLGPVRVAQFGGSLAALGVALAVAYPHPIAAIAGFGAVGAGLSVMFPIVLSASARTPGVVAGSAIATVSICGYAGLLAGPPLIGAVANVLTLRAGLALVIVACVGVVLLARVVDA